MMAKKDERAGREHVVPETYVPTIHGEPHEGYLHEENAESGKKK